jgi:hypothetical protein
MRNKIIEFFSFSLAALPAQVQRVLSQPFGTPNENERGII